MSANEEKKSSGTFAASVDGVNFLQSKLVQFVEMQEGYAIVGVIEAGEGRDTSVAFGFPKDPGNDYSQSWNLSELPITPVVWINKSQFLVASGETMVTFKNSRRGIVGRVDMVLKDGRKVTGLFDMQNP